MSQKNYIGETIKGKKYTIEIILGQYHSMYVCRLNKLPPEKYPLLIFFIDKDLNVCLILYNVFPFRLCSLLFQV